MKLIEKNSGKGFVDGQTGKVIDLLNDAIREVQNSDHMAKSVGVVVTYSDGWCASVFSDDPAHFALIGGLEWLKARILDDLKKP
ncbi:MAG: hypothetical protein MJE68_11560 [Proteobacteria bacterium]|nr:hypothetical protein [Pseudomonadota bacterium]